MIRPCRAITVVDGTPYPSMPGRLATGSESIITQVAIRLWTIRGTWPDDTLLGLPHMAWTLPNVPRAEVEAVVRRQVAAVQGVVSIEGVDLTWPGERRSITVRCTVETGDSGTTEQVVIGGAAADYIPGAWYYVARRIIA